MEKDRIEYRVIEADGNAAFVRALTAALQAGFELAGEHQTVFAPNSGPMGTVIYSQIMRKVL